MELIPPYQWELLASMVIYKVTGGVCLDFSRLTSEDVEAIYKATHLSSKGTLKRWGHDTKPVQSNVVVLLKYTSDIFPYQDLETFVLSESNAELFSKCHNWDFYLKKKREKQNTAGYKLIQEIKTWAYERVIALVERHWTSISFSGLHHQEQSIQKFAGEYKIFKPGQIPPLNFSEVYYDPLVIAKAGIVTYQNRYIKEWYHGNAIIKDKNALQIILFSEKNHRKDGFEYVFSIKVNNYGVTANHFAGICLSFNGNNNIYSYPILMTNRLEINETHAFVKNYFKSCYDDYEVKSVTGRMECQNPDLLLQLESMFLKK